MDKNQNTIIYVVVGILLCLLCLSLSGLSGYAIYVFNKTSGTNSGSGSAETKPIGYTTIITPDEYGCPGQTFVKTSSTSDNHVWKGNAAGDNQRFLYFDAGQKKLYCCRDPERCDSAKGGWFYGWNIDDSRLTFVK